MDETRTGSETEDGMDQAALYRDIVEESPDGIWVIDLDGRTLFANAAMSLMLGMTRDELAHATHADLLDEVGRDQWARKLDRLRQGDSDADPVEVCYRRRDGSRVWVLLSEKLLCDESGTLTAILLRNTDYTERRATIERLVESEHRLAEAQRIARIGSWSWDVLTDTLVASQELLGLYGLEETSAASTFASFLDVIHREDRADVVAALRTVFDGSDRFVFVARIQSARGGWVWIRSRGSAERDQAGRVTHMSGTHQDITEAKRAELALVGSVGENALLRAVASAANQAHSVEDALRRARSIVLRSQDLARARAFVPTVDGTRLEALHVSDADRVDDLRAPERAAAELALATRSWTLRRPVWDEPRGVVAFTVADGEEVRVVVTVTGTGLTRQPRTVESIVELVSTQLGRVAERESAALELAHARDEAKRASQLKSDFLATMSHEIRTPLNGVIGLNDLLLRGRLDDQQQRLASGVQAASRALLAVINDILDFSKIEAGRLLLEKVDFALDDVLDQVELLLGETARAKGLRLRFRTEDEVPAVVNGDPTRLLQVLTNLVSNAVKFTERGEILVEVAAPETRPASAPGAPIVLRLTVSDTGVGVEPDQAEAMFAPFAQADASTTRVYGGTGLGLAIAREIVDAFDGSLSYAPRAGGGSVFTFTALVGRATPDSEPLSPDGSGGLTSAPLPRAAPEEPRRSPRILVVEDNPVNQLVATGLLSFLGYVAEVAEDGVLALEILEREDFDAVLMDVQMPRMDGYATTRAIRQGTTANRDIPIIAMTAAAVEGERERCAEAGMDDFLTKPVDPVSMASVLAEWLDPLDEPEAVATPAGSTDGCDPADAVPPPIDDLDVSRLEMLREMDPYDTSYLDRAIANFMINSVDAVTAMRTAMLERDAGALRHASHKLVGGALNLGVTEGGECVRRIEWLADTGTTAGADDLLPAAEEALQRGRTALDTYRSWYSSLGAPSRSSS